MRTLVASLVAIIIGSVFLWGATDGFQALTSESARRLAVAKSTPMMPNVLVQTMTGKTERLHPRSHQVVVVEFIYTTCPTICQTAGSDLERLRDAIVANDLSDQVKIVSVSFDLARDGVPELKSYAERYNADGEIWKVSRPHPKDLEVLLEKFGIVVIPDEFGGYQHNAALHILNPHGQLVSIVDTANTTDALNAIRLAL